MKRKEKDHQEIFFIDKTTNLRYKGVDIDHDNQSVEERIDLSSLNRWISQQVWLTDRREKKTISFVAFFFSSLSLSLFFLIERLIHINKVLSTNVLPCVKEGQRILLLYEWIFFFFFFNINELIVTSIECERAFLMNLDHEKIFLFFDFKFEWMIIFVSLFHLFHSISSVSLFLFFFVFIFSPSLTNRK